ncbi:hypothetical protein [Legionella jamestowniensis]|uniref:Uncharacterized protein n=1 Tax=Legionella jamestowniensis TaxID=455 RepID=A0A0W0UNM6_9GAMM|nr:hypothetical protein [Legionella jamestowniensis]KTD09489.1 hypothetical protein Ljam_0839 [Legionella jamestowniensis]SFL90188.1 hypothetical protein SAMN02746073_2510 [Legionella jamestowniensis DSM 19215]
MANFKKYSGNYVEVIDKLIPVFGFLTGYYEAQQTKETYLDALERDLNRTAYLSYKSSAEEMKQRLARTEGRKDSDLSYTQGNLTGAVFTINGMLKRLVESGPRAEAEGTKKGAYGSIRLAYEDDAGVDCGLSIAYIRNDPDLEKGEPFVPVEERKHYLAVAIIKNITAAPKDREVIYITAPTPLADSKVEIRSDKDKEINAEIDKVLEHGEDITDQDIPAELDKHLNSKGLSHLLKGLFKGDQLSLAHFNQLDERIAESTNIDNHDFKKNQLQRLIDNARMSLPEDKALKQYLDEVEKYSLTDFDFFKDDNFERTLEMVVEQINEHMQQIVDSEPERSKKFMLSHFLTTYAMIELNERQDYQREMMLAQAKVVLKTGVTQEFDELLFLAQEKAEKDDPKKISALKELILNARKSLPEHQELQHYLNSEEERALTKLTFYDDFDQKLETIFYQINEHIGSKNTQLSNDAKLKNQLTFAAIRLEQYTKSLTEDSKEYPLRAWLGMKAEELRSLRDNSLEDAEIYRDVEFTQLISSFVKQGQELQDKVIFFSEQLKRLADHLESDKEAQYIHTFLLAESNTLKGIMANPSKAESYRDMQFTDLVSELLDQGFKKQQNDIINNAKTQIIRKISPFDRDNANRAIDLHTRLKKAEPVLPSSKSVPPQKHGQSFWQRHRNNIIGGLSLIFLTILITGLLASGLLAPLGLALAAGTVTTVLIAGGATVGGIALATTAKSAYEENKWANEEWAYENSKERQEEKAYEISKDKYDKAVTDIEAIERKRDEDLSALDTHFNETKPAIMKVVEDKLLVEEDSSLLSEVTALDKALNKAAAPPIDIIQEVRAKLDAVSTAKSSTELPEKPQKDVVHSENDLTIEKKVQ